MNTNNGTAEQITMNSMTSAQITRSMKLWSKTNRCLMIWSGPGAGKTSVGRQFAVCEKRKLYEFNVNGMDPVDLRGFGSIKNGKTIWNPPAFLPDKPGGVIQIEDLPNAHPQVLTSLYSLILDGKLGDYVLPKDTFIICNGNREADKSFVNKMPTALALRFIHVQLVFDLECFIENAIKNDWDPRVIYFCRAFPKHISKFDPNSKEKAQSVPRTMEFLSDFMKVDPDKDLILPNSAGTVGQETALDFVAFLDVLDDLPDVTAALNDPSTLQEIPSKPSVMFAFIGALAKHVKDKTMANFIIIAERMLKEKYGEFAVTMISDAIRYNDKLMETKSYISWKTKHSDLYVM